VDSRIREDDGGFVICDLEIACKLKTGNRARRQAGWKLFSEYFQSLSNAFTAIIYISTHLL
jgi:hypothetical protein